MSIFGSLVAHALVLNASWRWVFWIGLIFGTVSLVGMAVFYFPPSRPRRTEKTRVQVPLHRPVSSEIRNSKTWTSWAFFCIRPYFVHCRYLLGRHLVSLELCGCHRSNCSRCRPVHRLLRVGFLRNSKVANLSSSSLQEIS